MNEFIKNDYSPKSMVGVRHYFGLSKLATACYEKLWNHRQYLSVAELAAKVGCRPSNAYRALYQLEACGLVKSSMQAASPEVAGRGGKLAPLTGDYRFDSDPDLAIMMRMRHLSSVGRASHS
jgi:predicted transcriptional regulator